MRYLKKAFVIFSILFIAFFAFSKSTVIVYETKCRDKVGIIDENLSNKLEKVYYHQKTMFDSNINTHGDNLIEFIFKCQQSVDLYYYDATNERGKIDTEQIIAGLEWMIEQSVEKVNISLSNKIKHDEIQKWINNHPQIEVFASYNNRYNSFDYPAMYDNVIGSGCGNQIKYKDIDKIYKSNTIFIISNMKFYKGNSYLSVLSMLKNKD